MCGRFSLSVSEQKLQQQLPFLEGNQQLRPSYNIAPTQHAYVITNDQVNRLQYLTWGLVPFWSKDGKNTGRLINARSEGIESKPSFRIPIRKRRCLVIADSFYEWKKVGKQKIPYRILPKTEDLLVMAGIWDVWDQKEYPVKSFSIITTAANADVAAVHDRMPVLLSNTQQQLDWLEEQSIEEVLKQLYTPEEGYLKMYRVSSDVNSPRNNHEQLHLEQPEQRDLFSSLNDL